MGLINACDKAVVSCQGAARDKDGVIVAQDALNVQLNHRVVELQKEQASPSNSKTLWFVAGMLTTAITVFLVKP